MAPQLGYRFSDIGGDECESNSHRNVSSAPQTIGPSIVALIREALSRERRFEAKRWARESGPSRRQRLRRKCGMGPALGRAEPVPEQCPSTGAAT